MSCLFVVVQNIVRKTLAMHENVGTGIFLLALVIQEKVAVGPFPPPPFKILISIVM